MVRIGLQGVRRTARSTRLRRVFAHYSCHALSNCYLCAKLHTCPLDTAGAAKHDCPFSVPATYHEKWLVERSIEEENETHQTFGITQKLTTRANDYATCGFIGKLKSSWQNFAAIEVGLDGRSANIRSSSGTEAYTQWVTRGDAHRSSLRPVTTTTESQPSHSDFGDLLESLERFPVIECTLNKKNVSHDAAMHILCQRLSLSATDVTVRKTMDKVGDTYQRIRITVRGKLQMLLDDASVFFPRCGLFLYDFEGARQPYVGHDATGGTLFEIVLTDVRVSARPSKTESAKQVISKRIDLWKRHGFLNYFGPQHFGWFRGKSDSSYHLFRGDYLTAAYQLLNFTKKRRPWIELLERPLLYPLSSQESLRSEILKRLALSNIGPQDFLDTEKCARIEPDVNCTTEFHLLDEGMAVHVSRDRAKMQSIARESLTKLVDQNCFQMTTFQDYLWNQALSYVYQLFHVPERHADCGCAICTDANLGGATCLRLNGRVDTSYRKYTQAVCLPPVVLAANLPAQRERDSGKTCSLSRHFHSIYRGISRQYGLPWPHGTPSALRNVPTSPRKAVVHPTHVEHAYDEGRHELFLRFVLPPGSFLPVAMHQLLHTVHVPYAHEVIRVPTDDILWRFGLYDEHFIPTTRDIYPQVSHTNGTPLDELTADSIAARIRDEGAGQATDAAGGEAYRAEYLNMLDDHGEPAIPNFPVSEIARWSKTYQISNRERKRLNAQENLQARLETKDDLVVGGNPKLEDYCLHHRIPIRNGQGRADMIKKISARDKKYARLRALDGYSSPGDTQLSSDGTPYGRAAGTEYHSISKYPAGQSRDGANAEMPEDDQTPERRMRLKKGRGDAPLYYDINGSWWNRSYCRPFHPEKSRKASRK
ncbi:hypothetical protein XU18_3880 [Perkinsela sp. CCAP 1560/4]|nr:hypothetical protein XU18_3880 [Perkinsela sp. CCAP 1560/4]|eukprot:KNH05006.1 hypothetical protein XU18_3880 [Perkinsela sp. CCAP 1560/4]